MILRTDELGSESSGAPPAHLPPHHRALWVCLDVVGLASIMLAAWVSQWQIHIEIHNENGVSPMPTHHDAEGFTCNLDEPHEAHDHV